MKCKHCNRWLSINNFLPRDDRKGYHRFCSECMTEQGRDINYPPFEYRGGGRVYINFSELD